MRSPAKPPRSPREASVDQFPTITLSPPHLRLKTSPSFLPPAETWYLSPARQEPPRDQFAKAKVFREPVRSQPLHKSMPCVAISEAPQQPKKHGSFELVKSCLQSLKAMVFQQCWPSRLASLKSSRGPLLCGTSTKCHLEALEDLEGHAQTNFPSYNEKLLVGLVGGYCSHRNIFESQNHKPDYIVGVHLA